MVDVSRANKPGRSGEAGRSESPRRSDEAARSESPRRSDEAARPEKPSRGGKPPRKRREADEARVAILDAAERRLGVAGPGGIRLQDVADDVGVSHSTVLHHFGSREALLSAVIERSFATIRADLVAAISASSGGPEALLGMLNGVAAALAKEGHGRVLLWLALEGQPLDGTGQVRVADVVDAAHALRMKRRGGEPSPSRDDTGYTIVLGALALVASVVLSPALLGHAGLASGEAGEVRFRQWLARLLSRHLESGPG